MENTILSQKLGAEATVIISTFDRADFVIWALKSAQQQTIADIEIFVIGDGSSPVTRNIVEREAKKDTRILFFDNPKGERMGELHRHQAILQSTGKIICYLGHDDLWFPEHVESMLLLLKDADFVHSIHTYIAVDGTIHGFLPLVSDSLCRSRMLNHHWNRFGPTCSAHTRNIYFELPYGWRPAPLDIWSDLYMWRQFINHPGCRFTSLPKTTTISFPRSLRYEYSVEQREAELANWFPRLYLSDEAQRLSVAAIQSAAGDLLREIKQIEDTTDDLQREIIHLKNMAIENLRKLPINQTTRPLAFSLLLGKLYIIFDKLIPGKLTALKESIIDQMIARSGLFNKQFYMDRCHCDITPEHSNPVQHYLKAGWRIGKNPSPDFDANYYLKIHPDVLDVGINPLVHYIMYGYREKRSAIKLLN